jgi:5-methylcytosine-specific restriction endonuclease McrA
VAASKVKKPRKPPTDNQLLKAAIRKAFARSSIHREMKAAIIIQHADPKRKAVKTWCRCPVCKKPEAISNIQVDHILPVVPKDKTLEDLTRHEILDRIWCSKDNLNPICKTCHRIKTNAELKERAANRRARKPKKKASRR